MISIRDNFEKQTLDLLFAIYFGSFDFLQNATGRIVLDYVSMQD